jgi:hypothetical protein
MKKLFLLAALLLGIQGFSQKTYEVYNLTTQTVGLADIITRTNTSGYPEYHSKPFGVVNIPPGGSYILQNTSNVFRFPFESPTSVPYINKWERAASASGPYTIQTSPAAWFLGNSQVFYRMMFYVGSSYNSMPAVPPGVTTLASWVVGSGWQLDYDCSNPAPNVWNYTIVIY